jgi:eukaryotic-like serine/threonine-protein kinase
MHSDREKLIEDLYQGVLDLPPDQRQKFLSDECAGDTDLRGEIEALLRHSDAAPSKFLAGVADEVADDTDAVPLLDGMVGRTVGRYKLLRVIASGGMGTVYEAQQEQPSRTVAVKLVRQGLRSSAAVRRFQYESEVLGHLSHRGIAQVFESGVHREPGGTVPYFAMEYLSGAVPITEYATVQELGINGRISLFLSVCDAVQYAHQRAVIHRDLKPANVLVTPNGQPMIIDFGVARVLSTDVSIESAQTQTGQMIGTLRYMSPEQCGPTPSDVDARTDIYALGVILFELLTEQLPYDLGSTSPFDAPQVIRETDPTRPSTICSTVTGDLEVVLLKALEKDREQRYQSAAEFARDLRRVLTNEPIEAKRGSQWYVLRKSIARHKLAVTVVCGIVILIAASAVTMGILYREAGAQKLLTQEALHKSLAAEKAARRTTAFLIDLFEVADPFAGSADKMTAGEILDRGVEQIRRELADDPETRATLLLTIGNVFVHLGRFDDAMLLLKDAHKIRDALLGPSHSATAETQASLGNLYISQGEFALAEETLSAALAIQRKTLKGDHEQLAETIENLGVLHFYKGEHELAEPLLREALDMRRRLFGIQHRDIPTSLNNLALVLDGLGQRDESERLLRKALAQNRLMFGDSHAAVAATLGNLSGVLSHKGDIDGAIELGEEALSINRKVLGNAHPAVASGLNNLGSFLKQQGNFTGAEARYKEALDVCRDLFGESDFRLALVLDNIGSLLMKSNRMEDAEPYVAKALEIRRAALGVDHADTIECYLNMGSIRKARGDLGGAKEFYQLAYDCRLRTLGVAHSKTLAAKKALDETVSVLQEAQDAVRGDTDSPRGSPP